MTNAECRTGFFWHLSLAICHSGASVGFGEPRLGRRRAAALHAGALHGGAGERDVPERRLRVGLDLRLAVGAAAPAGDDEPGPSVHDALELVVAAHARRVVLAEGTGALQER